MPQAKVFHHQHSQWILQGGRINQPRLILHYKTRLYTVFCNELAI